MACVVDPSLFFVLCYLVFEWEVFLIRLEEIFILVLQCLQTFTVPVVVLACSDLLY